jgi:HAD superfamily hydrolase (TIGR01509 family)
MSENKNIKLVIFDMDGVLVDARELHYSALNRALESVDSKYVISRKEHLSTFDGLPTSRKLSILTETKSLPESLHDIVWKRKQEFTSKIIDEEMTHDNRMRSILKQLKKDGYSVCVASNSIRESVKMMLLRKGLLEYIDFFLSNQDVNHPKPHPEIYLKCMIKSGSGPKQTLIIEDSHIGRQAAIQSGAYLCPVIDTEDVTYEKICSYLDHANNKSAKKPSWQGGKMNVLIPMAGAGSRFQKAGYTFPKPLIEVQGKPMIQHVVENINIDATHVFIVQKSHYEKYNLKHLLNLISPSCKIIQVDGITEGAACTTLLAKDIIDNDDPLLIANSDQYLEWDSNEFMYSMMADEIDGGILTFTATHPKWSFAKLDANGFVSEVAEKKPISDNATCGVYLWKKGSDYVKFANEMIEKDIRTNNEFYVCPVFNQAIESGKKIKTFHIGKMWGLGTPEDLNKYIQETRNERSDDISK